MPLAVVNEETGVITDALDAAAARDILDGIKANLTDTAELIEALWTGCGWIALGYGSWDALVVAEIRGCLPKLERAERRETVAKLAAGGMSTRAIGAAIGVHHDTVAEDLKAGVGNPTPDPDAPSPEPTKTTGLDGKTYTRKPAPAPPVEDPAKVAAAAERQRLARVFDRTRTILSLLEVLVSEGVDPSVEQALTTILTTIQSIKERS